MHYLEPFGVGVAVWLRALAIVVILMVILRLVEFGSRRDAGGDFITLALELRDELFGNYSLRWLGVENLATVLLAHIWSLSINLRRIVDLEEKFCQRLVVYLRGIKNYSDSFGVPRFAAANLLIGRINLCPPDVA